VRKVIDYHTQIAVLMVIKISAKKLLNDYPVLALQFNLCFSDRDFES